MAKETVKVDNGLEEIELVKSAEPVDKKNDKKIKKDKKDKKENKKGYFAKVKEEMRLVTWPTKKNVFKYSVASILMIILLALFFFGMSLIFDLLYRLVQGWIG